MEIVIRNSISGMTFGFQHGNPIVLLGSTLPGVGWQALGAFLDLISCLQHQRWRAMLPMAH
jgi:hypothetical protein